MAQNVISPTDTMMNDLEIKISRIGGKWTVLMTGLPLPRDVSMAQKALSDYYRVQRRRIAESYNQSRQKFKELQNETKVMVREAKAKVKELEGAHNA